MTVLARLDPFREYNTLQDRMNRLFRDSYGDGREEALTTSTFAPPVDVYEDEHNITLKIEVPGIEEKDIDVQIENNTLTVHGERKLRKREGRELSPGRGPSMAASLAPSACRTRLMPSTFRRTMTRGS